MKYFSTAIILSIVFCLDFAAAQNDQSKEPPQVFNITIDGKVHSIELGKSTSIEIDGNKVDVQLKAEPYRQFNFAGVSFPYPSSFLFESETDEGSRNWTLEGNDIVLMLFQFTEEVDHTEWAEVVAVQYGSDKSKLKSTTMKLAGTDCPGTRLNAEVFEEKLQMEVYELPTETGTQLLVLQDMLSESGKPSDEMDSLKKMLKSKLKLKLKK